MNVSAILLIPEVLFLPDFGVVLVVEGTDYVQGEGKRAVTDKNTLSDGESRGWVGEGPSEDSLRSTSGSHLESGTAPALSNERTGA